jgi:hypothetical protein
LTDAINKRETGILGISDSTGTKAALGMNFFHVLLTARWRFRQRTIEVLIGVQYYKLCA